MEAARAPARMSASCAKEAKAMGAERSMRAGRTRSIQASRRAGARRRAAGADPRCRRTAGRRAARRPGKSRCIFGVTALRFSRCWRSAKGATTPFSRITSNSPSSTAWKSMASAISGKAPDTSSPPRLQMRRPPGPAVSCTRMPSHFHSARHSGGSSAGDVRILQRVRQHQRAEHRRVARVGALRPALPASGTAAGRAARRRARPPRSPPPACRPIPPAPRARAAPKRRPGARR